MAVPHDLNTDPAIFERHFKNLVGEIAIHIEFVKRVGEEFSLKREVHAHRPLGQMSPAGAIHQHTDLDRSRIALGTVLRRNGSDCCLIFIPFRLQADFVPLRMARLIDKGGAKADQACAAFVPHAWIKDSVRLLGEKLSRQELRRQIALRQLFWLKAMRVLFRRLQNVKGAVKVGLPIVISGDFLVRAFLGQTGDNHFCKPFCFVISDLCNRSCGFLGRIPGAARCVIEARPKRAWMKKRRANDRCVGNSVYQFEMADSAETEKFSLDTLVGCGIESSGIRKHRRIFCDLFQNGSGLTVSGGDQPMHSLLAKLPNRRRQRPPRQASSIRRTSAMPGWPWRSM